MRYIECSAQKWDGPDAGCSQVVVQGVPSVVNLPVVAVGGCSPAMNGDSGDRDGLNGSILTAGSDPTHGINHVA